MTLFRSGINADADLLAIGLAAINAIIEGSIEIAFLDGPIIGDLAVEKIAQRWTTKNCPQHARLLTVKVEASRTFICAKLIENRGALDRVVWFSQQLRPDRILMDFVEIRSSIEIFNAAVLHPHLPSEPKAKT